MSISKDVIDMISKLIHPCELSEQEIKKIENMSCMYAEQIIEKAIYVSYFNNIHNIENITHEIIADFLNYAEGTAYNLSKSPMEQKITHISNLGKKVIQDWKRKEAQEFLLNYSVESIINGVNDEEILKQLELILLITKKCISWKDWYKNIQSVINNNDIKAA